MNLAPRTVQLSRPRPLLSDSVRTASPRAHLLAAPPLVAEIP